MLDIDWSNISLPFLTQPGIDGKRLEGTITSLEEFYEVCSNIADFHVITQIERILKFIGKGICPASFPLTETSVHLTWLVDQCLGGEGGTDLIHLPYGGGVLDQPALFFEAKDIIVSERAKWYNEHLPKEKSDASSSRTKNNTSR